MIALFLALIVIQPHPATYYIPGEVKVTRAVDGDTVVVEEKGVLVVVRLVGVDTPETHKSHKSPAGVEPYGPEAAEYTAKRLVGQWVRLVGDDKAGHTDHYGRRIAYVFLGSECFNETLVKEGYGRAYVKYPFESATRARFAICESEAKDAKRGLWKEAKD